MALPHCLAPTSRFGSCRDPSPDPTQRGHPLPTGEGGNHGNSSVAGRAGGEKPPHLPRRGPGASRGASRRALSLHGIIFG